MSDSIPVIPALSFQEQISDLSQFVVRSLDESAKTSLLESLQPALAQEEEIPEEVKTKAVESVVAVITGGHPGLEGTDREIEGQYLLLTTLVLGQDGAEKTLPELVDAVVRSASGSKKAEVACRVLTNIYNLLPQSSSVRPHTLINILDLLTTSTTLELSFFPLTTSWLSNSLSQWNMTAEQKLAFLQKLASVYEASSKKGDAEKALEWRILAQRIASEEGVDVKPVTQEALKALLSIPEKFDLGEVLSVKGARDLEGGYKELVALFEESELSQGLEWVEKNGEFLKSESLDVQEITRKLRLLALTTLAANSSSKEITYSQIAQSLKVDESEIEIYVIDAIYSNLVKASLSQPTKTLRIQSVQTRSFGPKEWDLLQVRLGDWKVTLGEVQKVIKEATEMNENAVKGKRTRRDNKDE